jgi:hypothetical protein
MMEELIKLLHEVDGHLGLAIHRDEHSPRWKEEAGSLITRLRATIRTLEGNQYQPPPMAPPGPRKPNPSIPERRPRDGCIGITGWLFGHDPVQVVDQDDEGRGTICRRCMKFEPVSL